MLTSSSNLNKNSSMGIEGLRYDLYKCLFFFIELNSLDNVPNVDVSKILKQIAVILYFFFSFYYSLNNIGKFPSSQHSD